MKNKKEYKKFKRILSSQKKMLLGRKKDLKEAIDLMETGLKKFKNNTDIISAANVICHVPDLKNLITGLSESVEILQNVKNCSIFSYVTFVF